MDRRLEKASDEVTKVLLDCETRLSAEASLLETFGCSSPDLRCFLTDPDHEAFFDEHWKSLPEYDLFLYERACAALGNPRLPTELCWFHCTRVPAGTTFGAGILPLGQVLPLLKGTLLDLLEDTAAKREIDQAFAREGGLGFHFGNKLGNPLHWGPYAILVREVASCANDLGQHDYLAMPEIIEDLCEEVGLASGLDLLPVFQERLRPAVVKFVAPAGNSAEFAVRVALRYLQSSFLEGTPGHGAVWCFDGENTTVPPGQVLKVEFV
ncbi:hypothetical protein [Paraburkholderia tropica]|uniref:hypothetical protein n=1 Tax=Paraburkholderia tropica TaxID=92647 RepID=UPI0016149F0C|nr:hypothetical protein [Paraburkholderia tropica]MBB2984622.1 hypothetical protein [Paraburkholderia tropica]